MFLRFIGISFDLTTKGTRREIRGNTHKKLDNYHGKGTDLREHTPPTAATTSWEEPQPGGQVRLFTGGNLFKRSLKVTIFWSPAFHSSPVVSDFCPSVIP